MFLHENCKVEVSFQNFGSSWLVFLSGKSQDIELAFNSLFNHQATSVSGKLFWQGESFAYFWSSPQKMKRYFTNLFFWLTNLQTYKGKKLGFLPDAIAYAEKRMKEFLDCQEEHYIKSANPDFFNCGIITAEKPDFDLKDLILLSSLEDKELDNSKKLE